MKKVAISAALLLGACRHLLAQTGSEASTGITIPVSLSKTIDMHFYGIPIPLQKSTLTISPRDKHSSTGSEVVVAGGNMVSAASFALTGQPYYMYYIGLPGSCTLSDGNNHLIEAGAFICLQGNTGILNQAGTQLLNIGATFRLSPALPSGNYANTATQVTINYN